MEDSQIQNLIGRSLDASKSDVRMLLAVADEVLRSENLGEFEHSARARMFAHANDLSERMLVQAMGHEEALRNMVRTALSEVSLIKSQIKARR